MKKLLLGLIFLVSANSSFATTDLSIKVETSSDLVGIASAQYLATKDSFFCREFSMNDGSPTRVPKRLYLTFDAEAGMITIPAAIDSKCDYKRVGGASLHFAVPGVVKAYNVVDVWYGGGTSAVQEVNCEEVYAGPSGREKMILCSGDIKTDENGEATVLVIKN